MRFRRRPNLLILTFINLCLFCGTYLNIRSEIPCKNDEAVLFSLNATTTLLQQVVNIEQSSQEARRKETCTLQIPDPWDPSIRHLFPNVTYDYSAPKLWNGSRLVTTFDNDILRIINDSYLCKYRCFQFDSLSELKFHTWLAVKDGAKVSCEFFEVSCGERNGDPMNDINFDETYRMPYAQAVKTENVTGRIQDEMYRPSVIVVLIDSLSHSSAKRRLARSIQFLKEHLDLTVFDGYAKVGLNSRPNGIAFLTGTTEDPIFENAYDPEHTDDIQQRLIWNAFKKRGFVTHFSEDDSVNLIFGKFFKSPTDHFLGPFWTHLNSIKAWPEAPHRIGLTYLNQLLKLYENNPLFALSWTASLSHDQVNDLDDTYFLDFFQKSKALLKDSFLIVMGDHGMRFGELRSSVPGRQEDNLPFFSIALPEVLRGRLDIYQNLKQNSQILTNHFDLYVTLWDIMTSEFKSPFSQQLNWSNFTEVVRGQSLLRPISNNRTCRSLEMSPEYCPCYELTRNCTNMELREKLVQFAVATMNNIIKLESCEEMILEMVLDVEELVEQAVNTSDVYRVMFTTVPNNGTFQALLRHDRKSTIISMAANLVDRINLYGNASYCVDNHTLKRYCLCTSDVQKPPGPPTFFKHLFGRRSHHFSKVRSGQALIPDPKFIERIIDKIIKILQKNTKDTEIN